MFFFVETYLIFNRFYICFLNLFYKKYKD